LYFRVGPEKVIENAPASAFSLVRLRRTAGSFKYSGQGKKIFRRSSGHKLKEAGGMKEVRRVNHSEVPHVRLFLMNDTINPIAARQSRTASKTIDSIALSPFRKLKEK